SEDKICAYQTLYECLETVVKLMAPISPFFSDSLYLRLNEVTGRNKEESVHHVNFPAADEAVINSALEERMEMAQQFSSMILSLRKKENIKVRQPLQKVLIPVKDKNMEEQLKLVEELIKNEVNIKEIEYLSSSNTFIRKKVKPNFSVLGKKIGPKIKSVVKALDGFTQEDISSLEKDGSYTLLIDSEPLILQISDIEISSEDIPGWTVASKDSLTVALDITLTPELQWEGHARELVNRIQKIRKDNGYELTDKISVKIQEQNELLPAITRFNSYICAEILAESIEFVPELVNGLLVDINDIPLKLNVSKKA